MLYQHRRTHQAGLYRYARVTWQTCQSQASYRRTGLPERTGLITWRAGMDELSRMPGLPTPMLSTPNWHCANFLRYVRPVRKKTHGVETRSHSRCVFGIPAFGGGFFLTSVIHRVVDINRVFGSQQLLRALSLAPQSTKKPGVTRTTGRVMGESQIWPIY